MASSMQGHVAFVTGAGGGLGSAIARALHAAGCRVAAGDLDPAAAQRIAAALDPTGETALAVTIDVRSKAAFAAARDAILARWGDVQVLVNNAALTVARPVMDITPGEFDDVIDVNLKGTFLGCQVFGSHFRDRGYGRIVNIASLAGQNGGTATGAHYAASKGAILTLTKVFARDLAACGVTVNAVAPGPLDLPLTHSTVPPDRMPDVLRMIPIGKLGDPAFVGAMVVQLASPDAAFTTGATWDVNGGLFMR